MGAEDCGYFDQRHDFEKLIGSVGITRTDTVVADEVVGDPDRDVNRAPSFRIRMSA